MKKVLLTALLLLLSSFTMSQELSEDIILERVMDVSHIVGSNVATCTSVHVEYKNKIRHLTAAHCCKTSKEMQIYRKGNKQSLKVIKTDKLLDLCELEALPILTKIKVSNKLPEPLIKVYNFGFSSKGIFFEVGRLNNLVEVFHQVYHFYSSNYTTEGMSGGPFLDNEGNLLGIIIMRTSEYKNIAISAANVQWFLNR